MERGPDGAAPPRRQRLNDDRAPPARPVKGMLKWFAFLHYLLYSLFHKLTLSSWESMKVALCALLLPLRTQIRVQRGEITNTEGILSIYTAAKVSAAFDEQHRRRGEQRSEVTLGVEAAGVADQFLREMAARLETSNQTIPFRILCFLWGTTEAALHVRTLGSWAFRALAALFHPRGRPLYDRFGTWATISDDQQPQQHTAATTFYETVSTWLNDATPSIMNLAEPQIRARVAWNAKELFAWQFITGEIVAAEAVTRAVQAGARTRRLPPIPIIMSFQIKPLDGDNPLCSVGHCRPRKPVGTPGPCAACIQDIHQAGTPGEHHQVRPEHTRLRRAGFEQQRPEPGRQMPAHLAHAGTLTAATPISARRQLQIPEIFKTQQERGGIPPHWTTLSMEERKGLQRYLLDNALALPPLPRGMTELQQVQRATGLRSGITLASSSGTRPAEEVSPRTTSSSEYDEFPGLRCPGCGSRPGANCIPTCPAIRP